MQRTRHGPATHVRRWATTPQATARRGAAARAAGTRVERTPSPQRRHLTRVGAARTTGRVSDAMSGDACQRLGGAHEERSDDLSGDQCAAAAASHCGAGIWEGNQGSGSDSEQSHQRGRAALRALMWAADAATERLASRVPCEASRNPNIIKLIVGLRHLLALPTSRRSYIASTPAILCRRST